MSFAEPVFLWYFMPLTLAAYWLLPASWRNGLISVASLIFYAWGGGAFVLLLLTCIALNYAAGLLLDSARLASQQGVRRLVLVTAVVVDLGILAVWKYAGFASQQISALSDALFGRETLVVAVALPIGISFFTFHHLSYVVDVYRHSRRAQRSPVQFVTYIAMFPQLIAGPIVRYHEIADQLGQVRRHRRLDDFVAGFPRFGLGLAKKVIVADSVAPIADAAFAAPADELTWQAAWIGVLAYTIQIYFDFSGYSDMAIGLGRMFGFRLPENFARPYSALSITDFWRRWHMSLSRWFRDYVYIPLGGSRRGPVTTASNLWVVFVLCGLWHGANWTFLVWGIYHGALLVAERLTGFGQQVSGRAQIAHRMVTFLLVMIGWVPFRAASMSDALGMLEAMFTPDLAGVPTVIAVALTDQRTIVLALALLVVLLPRSFVLGPIIEVGQGRGAGLARMGIAGVAAPYAAVLVAAGTFSPFLYFQF